MAKVSKVVANNRKRKLADKHRALRVQLRKTIKNVNLPEEERVEALRKLQSLPRSTSDVRVRNRCELTGRPRGFMRKFRLSRIAFRELAHQGMIPGVTKSSW